MQQSDATAAVWDQQAEQAVLGSVLIAPAVMSRLADMIEPGDFYLPAHQLIYATMLRLHAAGTPPDYLLVADGLNGDLDAAGGIGYLSGLTLLTPTSIHAVHYAGIVRDWARRRRLVDMGAALSRSDAEDIGATIERAESMLSEVKRRGAAPSWEDKGSCLVALRDRLLGELTDDDAGLPTGLPDLDRLIRLKRGHLVVVGARPSLGKTSLGVTIARHVACRLDHGVLVLSLEMLRDDLWRKLIAIEADVPWKAIDRHDMDDRQRESVSAAVERLRAAPIDVAPAREWTVEGIRQAAREAARKGPLSLIVVDYLQLAHTDRRRENHQQEVAAISASLKGMALELECCVLALSQLNREPEGRANGRPIMSDLRDSGAQEQDCDVGILLSYPEGRRSDPPLPQVEERIVEVPKNRCGAPGLIKLGFRGSRMEFVPLEQQKKPWNPLSRNGHSREEETEWRPV